MRLVGCGAFFLAVSESLAFWLGAELLEFSESEELESLPELEELLVDEPELLVEVDSELVFCKLGSNWEHKQIINITLFLRH